MFKGAFECSSVQSLRHVQARHLRRIPAERQVPNADDQVKRKQAVPFNYLTAIQHVVRGSGPLEVDLEVKSAQAETLQYQQNLREVLGVAQFSQAGVEEVESRWKR